MPATRFYEQSLAGERRSAPAALRNREAIADILEEWLPRSGRVLEIASGTGEHAVYFAARFSSLDWLPSDVHEDALSSIEAWREVADLPNLRSPILLDASCPPWPVDQADAILCINMVHISPWSSAEGLIAGAQTLLGSGAPLILYGPWLKNDAPTAKSNLAFDSELRIRNPDWGLRNVEDFAEAAAQKDLKLKKIASMPANNLMLLFAK